MRRCLHLPVSSVLSSWRRTPDVLCLFGRFCGEKAGVTKSVSNSLGTVGSETFSPQSERYEKLQEQIRGLSEDDQRLIFDALQNPEQQPQSKMGGAGIGTKSGDMVAAFTCGRCDHRMVKKFSKHAYTKDEAKNIEQLLREKGESFVRIGNDYQVEPPTGDESSDV